MLRIEKLRVEYPLKKGTHLAVRDVDLDVRKGEFFTLLGPSGCGKTTTLRSVAGLETPTAGTIRIDDAPVFDGTAGLYVPTHKRPISMVFQSYAIWPHMSVGQNVGFPLEAAGRRRSEIRPRIAETLDMVGLKDYIDRPATQLSGGQQQRVALARAVIKNAKVLLLDEPLSNLDAKLREQMRHELRQLQQNVGTTTLYVTHDQEEALSMSDRIAVMNLGDVVELGTPAQLYLKPRHSFTARFIGQAEILPCRDATQGAHGWTVQTALGPLRSGDNDYDLPSPTHVMIRPEHIRLMPANETGGPEVNVLDGVVEEAVFSGKLVEYIVRVGAEAIPVQETSTHMKDVGQAVRIYLPPERCVLLED